MSSSSTNVPICLLCNCSSSCSLGQGDLICIQCPTPSNLSQTSISPHINRMLDDIPTEKREHFLLETGKVLVPVDSELFNVGFVSSSDVTIDGNLWLHERCLKWSIPNLDTPYDYDLIRTNILNAGKEKCSICDRFGASLICRSEGCTAKFHLPCAQSSGCFFCHSKWSFLCPQHLDSVVSLFGVDLSSCEACSEPGDVRGQLFCTNCDKHYHAECLMLESNRVVRTGWRCPDCKICQTCRQSGDDAEMIMCNVCDKGYHTFCLRNQSIPKDGWSCSSCLSLTTKANSVKSICSLCQNEILTKHPTRQCHLCQIRIHSSCQSIPDDYYDDDSAYICRSCSISSSTNTMPMDEGDDDDEPNKEIYRSSSNSKINRLISRSQKSNQSPIASPASGISTRKRRSIDYSQQSSLEYTSGGGDSSEMTTGINQSDPPFIFESVPSIKDESSEHSMDLPMTGTMSITIKQEEGEQQIQPSKPLRSTAASQKSGKGKPTVENRTYGGEISKKRARRVLNNGHRRASSPQSLSTSNSATNLNQVRTTTATGTGLRGRPPKVRKEIPAQTMSIDETSIMPMNALNTSTGSTGSTSYTVGAVKRDDDEHHAVTVLCASDELYTLGQDMCVSCGSFGFDEEGRLISCTQCGQSYHTYCSGLNKLSKVILKQGWRCLDCTVCEGCGKPTDESRLLLCDDCDISYHTYCLQPPLDQVPKGNWKCQWCVRCVKCGSTTPGPSGSFCLWENNYTECAPCHSLVQCPVCTKSYRTDDLIVQCTICDRWLHGSCEHILSEDSTLSTTGDFICSLCRPTAGLTSNNELPTGATSPKSSSPSDQAPLLVVTTNSTPANPPAASQPQLPTPKATKLDEGVHLTDTGLAQLKSIRVKPLPKKGPAAATNQANNAKMKRSGMANHMMGGIKRNNSNSIQDDDTMGNNAAGAGSGTSDDEGTKKTTATVPTTKAAKGYTGIGGFHVKVRGQRRRPDPSSAQGDQEDNLHDETTVGTNKRKRDRRPLKKKSVLEEQMPPEMQEAFFGSDLAERTRTMAQHNPTVASLQLNDQTTIVNNNHANEYTIKLDHDTVNRFLIKKATKLALAVKEEQRPAPVTPAPPLSTSLPPPTMAAADDGDEMQAIMDNEEFCKFVEYMMSSKTTQDPMLPLLGGPTDIEDFLDFIEHPETHNDLQAVDLLNNSNTANQNAAMETGSNLVQVIQPHQTTMINPINPVHHPNNTPGPLQTPTSNLVVMATNVNDNSKQIINNLAREMMESTGLQPTAATATTTTSSILSQSTIINSDLIVKQEFHEHAHSQSTMLIPPQQNWPQQPQTMIRIPPMPQASVSNLTPSSTTPTQDRSGTATTEHANLIERTREDELLGQNATMSNVLYCNMNHPDLRQQFPDFNERFKQMKKIWRKVPSDAKQHYTQQARLNRTKRRALKSSSSQSSNASKGPRRKNSSKQQANESEDPNLDGGAGSESRSSTPSSSATNETTTVIVHPNEHQEHPPPHMYQQPRQMYSPGSGNLMVGTPNNPGNFHHQAYQTPQRAPPVQQGYGTPVSAPAGYPPPQRFSFPPQQPMPPSSAQPQQSQSSPYFEYTPSTPRSLVHPPSSSAESTPIHHPLNPNATNPIRKSNSSSDPNTPYHHVSPMEDTSPYYQQQSPYGNPNAMKGQGPLAPQQQQPGQPPLLPRGMPPRPTQPMQRFPSQDGSNFVRTPSAVGTPVPGQPARFIFTSPSNQPPQQATHYVQYTATGQAQHTVVVQQGTAEGFQRMPESPVHQHMQPQGPHHQPSPQFSPHHHPMTPNAQTHSMHISQQQQAQQQQLPPPPPQQQQQPPQQQQQQQQQHISPYATQQQMQQPQPSMHYIHPQHSPTIVVQPTSQFSPSSVHHHQLTLNNNAGHQSPPTDPNKRQIQMQKPAQQLLIQHEPMNYDEPTVKQEPHDDSLNESMNSTKSRSDPLQSVPPHVLEQIDEVINDVVSGAGVIPQDNHNAHPPSVPVQIVPLPQAKLPTQHLIPHPSYVQQNPDWSSYNQQQQQQQHQHQHQHQQQQQQQPTLNIAAMRGPPPYQQYHPQGQGQTTNPTGQHDLLPATTNVINTVGVPQHEQQQIVAERISSILSSTPHDQQSSNVSSSTTAVNSTGNTTTSASVPQQPIQIKRTWTMNPHVNNESHYLATASSDPSISLEDLLERDFKDKQQQQQQSAIAMTEWPVERSNKPSTNATTAQQTPLSLAHAVHLLQQAITQPLYQQNPPPELSGLISVGRDNEGTAMNAAVNEEQFERYARWLKQRREINGLRIKAEETNLADIKKKRNILMRKQKQASCTPEEEQEMPRLSQQQTEYSRLLTTMRKEKKQFDELEQAFLVFKQSRLNSLYPTRSSPAQVEQQTQNTETVVRVMTMNSLATPTQAIQSVQHPISEPISNMIYTTSSSIVPGLIGTSNTDEHEDPGNDDQHSLSPHDPSSKSLTFTQLENHPLDSNSTLMMSTTTDSFMEQSNTSPNNHEYEPSHMSPTLTEHEHESIEGHVQITMNEH